MLVWLRGMPWMAAPRCNALREARPVAESTCPFRLRARSGSRTATTAGGNVHLLLFRSRSCTLRRRRSVRHSTNASGRGPPCPSDCHQTHNHHAGRSGPPPLRPGPGRAAGGTHHLRRLGWLRRCDYVRLAASDRATPRPRSPSPSAGSAAADGLQDQAQEEQAAQPQPSLQDLQRQKGPSRS